jgi:hypothetical protein
MPPPHPHPLIGSATSTPCADGAGPPGEVPKNPSLPAWNRNPYPPESSDHRFWERYQAAYHAQPLSAQLYELESQIRAIWLAIGLIRDQMEASPNRDACSEHLGDLDAVMRQIERLADAIVTPEVPR